MLIPQAGSCLSPPRLSSTEPSVNIDVSATNINKLPVVFSKREQKSSTKFGFTQTKGRSLTNSRQRAVWLQEWAWTTANLQCPDV